MTQTLSKLNPLEIYSDSNGLHPAFVCFNDYDSLIEALESGVKDGTIKTQTDEFARYQLFCYDSYAINDSDIGWTLPAFLSRGLIIDRHKNKIAALPFTKFFNWGEATYELPDEPFTVTDKVDGSLGVCFWYEPKIGDAYWRVATKGSFNSEQAKWATEWLNNRPQLTKQLDKNATYLFEIVYRDNKIVVQYDYDGLVLLGAYNNTTGHEIIDDLTKISHPEMNHAADETERFSSIDELVRESKSIPYNKEGWVIRYDNGYRIKIKGDEYCRIHKLITQCTPLSIWECFMKIDGLSDIRKNLPEEFTTDFDNILSIIERRFEDKMREIREWVQITESWTDKEIGLNKHTDNKIPREIVGFIFSARKWNLLTEAYRPGKIRRSICETFRPKNNYLEGYVPSDATKRFMNG